MRWLQMCGEGKIGGERRRARVGSLRAALTLTSRLPFAVLSLHWLRSLNRMEGQCGSEFQGCSEKKGVWSSGCMGKAGLGEGWGRQMGDAKDIQAVGTVEQVRGTNL